MHRHRKFGAAAIAAIVFGLVLGSPSVAIEVFKWVDEDGVVHFSDEKPPEAKPDLSSIYIASSNPSGYDPAEDYYSIRNQAARTNAAYKEVEKRREARAEKRAEAAERAREQRRQAAFSYREPVRTYISPFALFGHPFRRHPPFNRPHPFKPDRFGPRPQPPAHVPDARADTPKTAPPRRPPTRVGNRELRWAPSEHPH